MFPGMAGEDRISGMMHEKSARQLLFPWSSAPKYFAPPPGLPCTGFPSPTKGRRPPATLTCPPELGRRSRSEILWREENKFEKINGENENEATATIRQKVQCRAVQWMCWMAWNQGPKLTWEERLARTTHMKEGARTKCSALFLKWLEWSSLFCSWGEFTVNHLIITDIGVALFSGSS